MLQSIREHTQGWFAGMIISLLILSFALWGIHSYFQGGGASNIVAKVNGAEITKGQLSVAYERLRRQLQMQFSANYELPQNAEASLKQRALQTLINIETLKQASLADRYRITSDQIDSFLQSMPEFQVNGEFSLTRFQQALATTLFTAGDFLELIKTTLLIDQPRLGIMFTSYALPNEINDSIALIGQERKIQYLVIPQQYFANQPVTISNDSINAYYTQHENEYKTPEQVSIQYVTLSVKDLADKIHPTDEQLKNFYNENSSSFASPAQMQLDEIIIPITANATEQDVKQARGKMDDIVKAAQAGKDFASLAKQYSVGLGDKKLQQWATVSQLPVELQKTASSLTKVGQLSEPAVTSNGLVLLKLTGYKEPQVQSFDKVKDRVKEMLTRQKAEEQFADMREKLASITYEHPDTLQGAASELGLQVKTTDLFSKDKGGKDITSSAKIREAAFSNDVLNLQNNSDVIQTAPESAMVIRVKSHVPASLLPLSAVQKQITDKLKANAIDEKLSQFAQDIQHKLQTGALTAAQVSSQYHLQWSDAGFIGRHATKIDQAILDSAFAMPRPQQNGVVYSAAKISNGFAVIALSAVKEGEVNVPKEQYQAFAEQIQNSEGMLEYELYKDSLMHKAKIEMENQ